MARIEITTDNSGAAEFMATRFNDRLRNWAERKGVPMLEAAIKREAPVKTGKLRESTHVTRHDHSDRDFSWSIESDVDYAKYVVKGTRPHRIEPHMPPFALHWVDARSGDVFARFVNHPGTFANEYPRRAVEKSTDRLSRSFRDAFK